MTNLLPQQLEWIDGGSLPIGGGSIGCDPNPWQPDFIMPAPDPIDRPGPTWPPMPGCY